MRRAFYLSVVAVAILALAALGPLLRLVDGARRVLGAAGSPP